MHFIYSLSVLHPRTPEDGAICIHMEHSVILLLYSILVLKKY